MSVSIRYCVRWNYKPHAVRAAAALKNKLGLDTTLIEGDRGEFTIWVDRNRVFSKTDAFPSDDEVVRAVQGAAKKS